MEAALSALYPVRVEMRPLRGRCLVAARDLPAGAVVLAASAAAVVAVQPEHRCGYCFSPGSGPNARLLRCSQCKRAHYCCAECQRSDWPAHRADCKLHEPLLSQLQPADAATLQLLARLLSGKAMRPAAAAAAAVFYVHERADVAALASDTTGRLDTHFQGLVRLARQHGLVPQDADEDDATLVRLLNAFDVNNLGVLDELLSLRGSAVCPAAALLNHSCCPSTMLGYTFPEELALELESCGRPPSAAALAALEALPPASRARRLLVFRTSRAVAAGEELTHSYVEQVLLAAQRREYLRHVYRFECDCPACMVAMAADADVGAGVACHERAMLAPAAGAGVAPVRVGVVRAVGTAAALPGALALASVEEGLSSDYSGLSLEAASDIRLAQSMLSAAAVASGRPDALEPFGLGPDSVPSAVEREALRLLSVRRPQLGAADEARGVLREVRVLEAALALLRRHLHPLHVQCVAALTMLSDRYALTGDMRALAAVNEHLCAMYRHVYGGLAASACPGDCAALALQRPVHPILALQLFTLGDAYLELATAASAAPPTTTSRADDLACGVAAAQRLERLFVEQAPFDEGGADAVGARVRPVTLLAAAASAPPQAAERGEAARAWQRRAAVIFDEVAAALAISHGAVHPLTLAARERALRD